MRTTFSIVITIILATTLHASLRISDEAAPSPSIERSDQAVLEMINKTRQLRDSGRPLEARRLVESALLQLSGVDDRRIEACLLHELALTDIALRRFVDAEISLRIAGEVWSGYPGQPEWHVTVLYHLSRALIEQSRTVEAENLLYLALSLAEEKLPPDHPRTSGVLHTLGVLYWAKGDLQRASHYISEALRRVESTSGLYTRDAAVAALDLAEVRSRQGEHREALRLCRKSVDSLQTLLGPNHPQTITALLQLGMVHIPLAPQQAELTLRLVQTLWGSTQGASNATAAAIDGALARARLALGEKAEALELNQRSLMVATQTVGEQDELVASLYVDRALILKAVKRRKEAEQCRTEASRIQEANHRPTARDGHTISIRVLGKR